MSMDSQLLIKHLEDLYAGTNLSQANAFAIFSGVMQGQLDHSQLAALLVSLKIKGETAAEIAGAADAMRANAASFERPDYHFADIVGTGGDGHNTINISSAAAIVAASCGIKVAKHGNRSVSSKSGSADLFAQFGYELMSSPDVARQCLDMTNFCFLFAPVYHAGVKHAMPVRTALKTRTLFNILGPLANPAKPSHSVLGVYSPELLQPYADVAQRLSMPRALIVHGSGLDEIAVHGETSVIEIDGEQQSHYSISPADFGFSEYPLAAIAGGEPEVNRQMIADVLAGQGEAAHEAAIAMNAAALIHLHGKTPSLAAAAEIAVNAMRSGKPIATIEAAAKQSQIASTEQ
ncbi:anthranilate phosphoribosyltransferase [Alteromonas sp. ASW11-36]|uniref:Anthranilate phosphoribosyltransferase n=1 Tax=Alteromonas arenosi TaxID=3055817 RepID=A0ABT7SUK7_9ALTE|nr:anthranilate phosphoribosyltransferase [Alteromonas sp. ASW11-36]MDM7859866.1 anthranilate phosphoribosyltransferase [Alteromonas sp. ASW11-36]